MPDIGLERQQERAPGAPAANGSKQQTRSKWLRRPAAPPPGVEEPVADGYGKLDAPTGVATPAPSSGATVEARPQARLPLGKAPPRTAGGTLMSILPVSAPVVLMVGPFVTVLVYVLPIRDDQFAWWSRWGSAFSLAVGVLVAMTVAVVWAIVQRGQATPEQVNSRLYSELCDRWNTMDARLHVLCPRHAASGTAPSNEAAIACREAWAHRDASGVELKLIPSTEDAATAISDVRWLLGTGFVSVYARIHSAEEALTVVEPQAQLVGESLSDELRIKDSALSNRDDLLHRLRWAITVLGGAKYLCQPPALVEGEQLDQSPEAHAQARIVLRQVRQALNRFRDERRGGLASARSQLIWIGLLTGLIAYALLGLAILVDTPKSAITAAVVFYLIGAMIGLLDQLRTGANGSASTEEDFGLARMRLFYSPVLSGLAAIGGVVVIAMLHASLSGAIVEYPAAGASADVATTLIAPPLDRIFDLEANRFGVVLAAIFGLTPSLLVARVQGLADRYQADLRSTAVQAGDE